MKLIKSAIVACALATAVTGCKTNPVTGRKTFQIVPESEMRSAATQQYASFLSTNRPANGTADAAMVQRVGQRMATAVQQYMQSIGHAGDISGYQWEFNLVNNNEANAWCMPGGKVVVYTGILPLTQNEAGLAVVMGHEIAHAVARHGNERMSQQLAVQGLGTGLAVALSSKPAQTQSIWNTVYGVGSTLGVLAYSRTHESEADHMGLIFMALAGYNPNEAPAFWTRMASKGGQKQPEFLSTHPSDQRRINDIKGWIPEAMKSYKPQGK